MRLSRDEAIARIEREWGAAPCLMCALIARDGARLATTETAVTLVPEYGLVRGHLIVAARAHVTRFSDLPEATWQAMARLAHEAARAVERTLAPARCYVASLGTARADLPMSCPHLHQHVVPVMDTDARPAEVFTWARGVEHLDATETEALLTTLKPALRRVR